MRAVGIDAMTTINVRIHFGAGILFLCVEFSVQCALRAPRAVGGER